MKKLVMTVAVLACATSMVAAQTVTSANVVGYNKDIGAPGFHISGYAFTGSDTSPQGVFGDQLPLGSKLYTFNGATYDVSTYESVFSWVTFTSVDQWNPNTLDLSGANGFWVENVGAASATAVLSGEVELAATVTNSVSTGFQLLSYPYPVASTVADLGLSPAIGDKIYAFNGATYDVSTYESVFSWVTFTSVDQWNPNTLTIGVGEGFWYEATAGQTWIANRPFTP